jgi:hypothetical protein
MQELGQLDADFGDLTIDWKTKAIIVETEPITLEDVYLGPFAIHFLWERLGDTPRYLCFDVVALEPNPSSVDEDVTHPHVRHQKICAGEATTALQTALDQGRLADAFSLMTGILSTYNQRSPFVSLESWDGHDCYDCGCSISADESYYCDSCDHDYCDECSVSCSVCDSTRCHGCLDECTVCEDQCCPGCLKNCAVCSALCCPSCLAEVEGSQLCADCRTPKPVPTEQAGAVSVACP